MKLGHVVPNHRVAAYLRANHYLGPAGAQGWAWQDDFGVMVFSNPRSRALPSTGWLELVRWCLRGEPNDGSQQWAEFTAWARTHLRHVTTFVSYSDPAQGHSGALYRACNWLWAPTWLRLRPPPQRQRRLGLRSAGRKRPLGRAHAARRAPRPRAVARLRPYAAPCIPLGRVLRTALEAWPPDRRRRGLPTLHRFEDRRMKPVTSSVVGNENAPASAEASEEPKSLSDNSGGGGIRTPMRFLAPHFEGHTPDHAGTPTSHESAEHGPHGATPEPSAEPLATPDHAQHVPNPVSSHTPGPWVAHHWAVTTPGGLAIADVVGYDEPVANARLIAASPALLDSLLAVEWAGAMFNDDGDYFDACPNCAGAPTVGHYVGCELRDALDAAHGVKSPRVVHPAHGART